MNNLYGLVLAGGKSSRMKQDKSLLSYHGKSQVEHTYDLLSKVCTKVFVSNRKEQTEGHKTLPQIHDLPTFQDSGPLSGILSAMSTYPQVAWLVLACDLPFVTEETLQTLIDHRDPKKLATAYRSAHEDGLPEPLCAIWEANGQTRILSWLGRGIKCPRKIMIKSGVHLINQTDPKWLDNVNSPEEFQQARIVLDKSQNQHH